MHYVSEHIVRDNKFDASFPTYSQAAQVLRDATLEMQHIGFASPLVTRKL